MSCGPVGATSVIGDAEAAGARARAAHAEKSAPYEMTSAELYLQKAREQQGRARYGVAQELARKSVQFADEATRKAAAQRGAEPAPAAPPPPRTKLPSPAAPAAPAGSPAAAPARAPGAAPAPGATPAPGPTPATPAAPAEPPK